MLARVLIVDDDVVMLSALADMITHRMDQVAVETCDTASAALDKILLVDYDVIISDIKMPHMDGLQLMHRVLELRPSTPTLLVTGHGDHDLGVHALNAGAYAFVQKPIDRDFFVAWLNRAIQLRRLSRRVESQAHMLEQIVRDRTAELQRTAERLELAQEAGHIGTFEWNIQTGEVTWSGSAERLYGLPEHGFGDRYGDWRVRVHPEDLPRAEAAVLRSAETMTPLDVEFRIVRPAGDVRWLGAHARVFPDEHGRPRRMVGLNMDITERKESERLNALLAAIVTSSHEAIISMDLQDVITSWNKAAERLYGYQAEEAIGQPLALLIPPHLLEEELELLRRLKRGERMDQHETLRARKDGQHIAVSLTASPIIDVRGQIIGVSKVAYDLTKRQEAQEALRQSERRLTHALDATVEGVWDWNVQTGEVFYSRRWIESLGYSVDEVLPHISFWQSIVHPDDMASLRSVLQAHFDGRTEVYEFENRLRMKNGEYRWNLDRGKVVEWDENGKPLRMVGTDTDITERKRAEERIRHLNEELAQRVQEFETLINTVPIGIGVATDARCEFIWGNQEFRRMLHAESGENQNLSKTAPQGEQLPFKVFVDGQEVAADDLPMQRACREGREVLDEELMIVRSDGTILHELARATPLIDAMGKVRGCIGAFLDITAWKPTTRS